MNSEELNNFIDSAIESFAEQLNKKYKLNKWNIISIHKLNVIIEDDIIERNGELCVLDKNGVYAIITKDWDIKPVKIESV